MCILESPRPLRSRVRGQLYTCVTNFEKENTTPKTRANQSKPRIAINTPRTVPETACQSVRRHTAPRSPSNGLLNPTLRVGASCERGTRNKEQDPTATVFTSP